MKHSIFTLIILAALTCSVGAQQLMVLTEERPPYNYQEGDEIMGLSTEIVRAVLNKAGIEAKFRLYPWTRAYKMASERENALIYSIVRSPEREELFKWVGPLVPSVRIFLYKLKDRTDIVIDALDDAKQYTIGVTQEDSMHQYLLGEGFEEGKQLAVVTKDEQSMEKLFRGRVDLIAEGELSIPLRMKSLDLPVEQVEKVFLLAEWNDILYMAFSQQTPDELVERARTAFEQLNADGTIDGIIGKYLEMSQ